MPFDPNRGNSSYSNMYNQSPQPAQKNKSMKPVIIGGVIVLVLAVVAFAGTLFVSMNNTANNNAQSQVSDESNYTEIEIFDINK